MLPVAPEPITTPVPQPDLSDPVKRGSFLVTLIGCADCHTPVDSHRNPIAGMDFAGGQIIAAPWGKAASANLTPDPTGIPYSDEALFIKAMRTGAVGARELNGAMPWSVLRNMTDQDLAGIFAYLKTLKPVTHRVDNSFAATLCPLDGRCTAQATRIGSKNSFIIGRAMAQSVEHSVVLSLAKE